MANHGPIEKLRAMADTDRLAYSPAQAALEELDADSVRQFGEALVEMADAIEAADDLLEVHHDAEGRDEKAEAKAEALEAFTTVADMAENDLGEADLPAWLLAELTTKRLTGGEG